MKRCLALTFALSFVLGLAAAASAIPYHFDMGPGSWIDTSQTGDPGLVMYATMNPNLGNVVFDLEPGESQSFYFARLGTREDWINSDDLTPKPITAHIDFDNPDLVAQFGGTSVGFKGWLSLIQGWEVTWQDPLPTQFGNGGRFTFDLSDAKYKGFLSPEGWDEVCATVAFDSSPAAPVPEPGTMLLLGSGLIAFARFARKKYQRQMK